MLHITPVRRPTGGLRKPSSKPSHKPQKTDITPKVNQELQNRIILLELGQHEALKNEIVTSLSQGIITASECLQLFINTAWKDRNKEPLIAHLFHEITQESNADFSLLIDSKCENLLKALTVLGKPTTSDLSLVTLLANLYHIEDLPTDHKDGLEMYLVDIAKAFWPYFMPEKNSIIWNDDICDCVCDVLMAVGRTLDEKCPINMERTFNNITIMMFTSCVISNYTLLRFLELKELRAASWCLANTAKSYYKSAYSKHDRSNSCSSNSESPVSQSSVDDDYDDVFDNDQYKVTISKNHVKNGLKHPVVVRVQELESKNPIDVNEPVTTEASDNALNHPESSEDGLNNPVAVHIQELEKKDPIEVYQPASDNGLNHPKAGDNCLNRPESSEDGLNHHVAVHSQELGSRQNPIDVDKAYAEEIDDIEWAASYYTEETENDTCEIVQLSQAVSCNKETMSENTVQHRPQGFPGNTRSQGFPGNTRSQGGFPGSTSSQGFPGSASSQGGFPRPGSSTSLPRTLSESDSNSSSNGTQGRSQGFPGSTNSLGGFPGNTSSQDGFPGSTSSQGGFSKPWNHSFQRTLSESDSNVVQFRPHGFPGNTNQVGFGSPGNHNRTISENNGYNGHLRPQGFPGNTNFQGGFPRSRTHSLQRTMSENNDNYDLNKTQGFPGSSQGGFTRPTNHHVFQRSFSASDGMANVGGFARRQTSNDRPWQCMLEFPVQEENGTSDKNSRLYLLSFAANPSALERPADLTLTEQLKEEKPWLRDVVLTHPKTVLERFAVFKPWENKRNQENKLNENNMGDEENNVNEESKVTEENNKIDEEDKVTKESNVNQE